ncbi:52 kDa repressor of the inhibitor of the protein kinase-like [Leptopilina boulardi]|uniref:52 kDa repressor of the inhibitor of the protein kinase-like n=1 Tax=Leptopilina boulardi TaxID=63433 RepID=UPI0021F5E32B|nr:52 kDa repressor of the inhibitor of the protein kinase-like [Leptopilina boulardi]
MAFRGNSDKLFTPNNGKFLGLVQTIAKFDPVMENHLNLAVDGKIVDHYCVNRWKILTDHVELYTLKKLSDTHWEAKISSVKAVRYQIGGIHDALVALSEIPGGDSHTAHEAITLAEQLKDFSFLVSLIVWYDILFQINIVSKSLQAKDMDITECVEMLKNYCNFLEDYRKEGFKKAIVTARELADELEIEPIFKEIKRVRRVKRIFDEKNKDEPITCPEKKLEVEFFNPLLDTVLSSIKERFQHLNEFSKIWGFLYNVDNLPDRDELLEMCNSLQIKLTINSKSDIEGGQLCDELLSVKGFLVDKSKVKITPLIVLNFIKKHDLQDLYPNIWIAMRILLTIPVTVASGERSFSKLKLIKTYLRLTMSQNKHSNLATLSIEHDIAENLDTSVLIQTFAEKKARKVDFRN